MRLPLTPVRSAGLLASMTLLASTAAGETTYPIVDTGQSDCYDDFGVWMFCADPGEPLCGQDASHAGTPSSYTVSGDGLTVLDTVTGLTWTRTADWNGDGIADVDDKLSFAAVQGFVDTLNAEGYGGFSDWRVPTTKQLYSLIDFDGTDPPPEAQSGDGVTPFIDDEAFGFAFGDVAGGERIIDSQWVTSTLGVNDHEQVMFGVNFADGRIKGYPTVGGPGGADKLYNLRFCRGASAYGTNDFVDDGDGTVTDRATGLMWAEADSGAGMDWEAALAYCDGLELAGHTDWRLPNAKELQSIVDSERSPQTTGSAAIDPVFQITQITNEAGEADYPFFWTGTSHLRADGSGANAVYVVFGRGLGSFDGTNVIDVHGAGCQRSDPKQGDPAEFPRWGFGPQGDVQRVFNFVRPVRDAAPAPACTGDVDGDGDTDVFDFGDLAGGFGNGPGASRAEGDLTGDGWVDVFDFAALAADFGCPGNG